MTSTLNGDSIPARLMRFKKASDFIWKLIWNIRSAPTGSTFGRLSVILFLRASVPNKIILNQLFFIAFYKKIFVFLQLVIIGIFMSRLQGNHFVSCVGQVI